MRKNQSWIVVLAVVFALLVPVAVAVAQPVVTQKVEFEVLRLLNNRHTVILKNLTTGEYVKYDKIPDNVTVYVNDKPAKMTDLRRGMKLTALRIENAPPAVVITESAAMAEKDEEPAPAAAPAAAAPAPAPAAAPAPAPAPVAEAPAAAPAKLPSTASNTPLLGLAGVALLLLGFAAGELRRRRS